MNSQPPILFDRPYFSTTGLRESEFGAAIVQLPTSNTPSFNLIATKIIDRHYQAMPQAISHQNRRVDRILDGDTTRTAIRERAREWRAERMTTQETTAHRGNIAENVENREMYITRSGTSINNSLYL